MKLSNVRLVGKLQDESFTKKDGTVITNSCAMFQENNSTYAKPFKCQFYGKSIDVIKGMTVNNDYDLQVNIESNEYSGKHYTKISCYGASSLSQSNVPTPQPSTIFVGGNDNNDDLPF